MATGLVGDVEQDVDYSLAFGLRRIAYEGGPSLDSTGNSAEDANQAAAWADPRMEGVIASEQKAWNQAGGDLLVYFYWPAPYPVRPLLTTSGPSCRMFSPRLLPKCRELPISWHRRKVL